MYLSACMVLLKFRQILEETSFVELILYLLVCRFTQKGLFRRYFQQIKLILWQYLIFYDLDLFRQIVDVYFFQNLVVTLNRIHKME